MTHRPSQIVTMVLAIAALAAVGGVAYTVMHGSMAAVPPAGRPGGASLPDVLLGNVDDSSASSWPGGRQGIIALPTSQPGPSDPLSLLAAGAGEFALVQADPGGLEAPPSARRVRTVRQSTPAGLQEVGVYLFTGPPDVIESFYAQRLAAAGWTNLGRARSGVLRFSRAGQVCTIQVGQAGGRDVEFHVVVQRFLPSP